MDNFRKLISDMQNLNESESLEKENKEVNEDDETPEVEETPEEELNADDPAMSIEGRKLELINFISTAKDQDIDDIYDKYIAGMVENEEVSLENEEPIADDNPENEM